MKFRFTTIRLILTSLLLFLLLCFATTDSDLLLAQTIIDRQPGNVLENLRKEGDICLEGYTRKGEKVFDSGVIPKEIEDWQPKDLQGRDVPDGFYFLLITLTKSDGTTVQNTWQFSYLKGQFGFQRLSDIYNKGNYKEAADYFTLAARLQPTNTTHLQFLGAAIYAQAIRTGELNEGQLKPAIEAYQKVLEISNDCKTRDNAFGYLAVIYQALGQEQKWMEFALKRTDSECATTGVRASTFYAIGVNHWKCAYELTQNYADKRKIGADPFHFRSITRTADRDRHAYCTAQAFEFIEKALLLRPDYADALSYKSLLYREKQKTAGTVKERLKLQEQAEIAARRVIEINKQQSEK